MRNYRLFLFKPTAINYEVNWNSSTYRELLLGELKVDNLKVSLKLQDISTINFDLPESIFGEINPRLDEVLDNYIVELWYGDVSSNSTAIIKRFIITKSPLEYEGGVKRYCYEGSSLEYLLEFKQLLSWSGVKVNDFYRTIRYDSTTDTFTETPSTGNSAPTYSLNTSSYAVSGEQEPVLYITVPTTTAAITPPGPPSPFDIFIYQYRRNNTDTSNSESSIIEYEQNIPSGTLYQNESGFKPGFYVPVLDANGKVTSIHIALPKDFKQFNSASKVFEIFLYDNPVSRHFAIGINTDQEIQASDMYLSLAQNKEDKFIIPCRSVTGTNILTTANLEEVRENLIVGQTVTGTGIPSNTKVTALDTTERIIKITISNNSTSTGFNQITFSSLNASEYGAYAFTAQSIYSKNGLKLEHILLGNVETRDAFDAIDNNTLNEDGLLFDTGFTIGKVHDDIAAKYRSNIELNNLTKYEAIKNLAESFDAIAIFNSVTKTVSFYPDKNEEVTDFVNNGLIITQNNYLKNLTNDIDSSKIITRAYAAGKDNLSISLITPNGSNAWEDYSYFLDSYYVEYPAASGVTIANDDINNANNNTGVKYTDFPTGSLARWIDSTEALKIAKWQYARDYFHDIMLGNLNPTVSEHDRYYNLYNLRSAAINDFVKEETKYFELKAIEYKYKYLYDFYVKQSDNTTTANSREQNFVYKFSSTTTVADPGSTYFRLNNASFANVTEIVIDDLDNSSTNRRTFLAAITTNNNPRIMLSDTADVGDGNPTNYIFYQINSVDSTNTGYIILSVKYINRTQSGTGFTNNNTINLEFQTWKQIYQIKYNDAVSSSAFALARLDTLHYNLYNTRFNGTVAKVGDSDYTNLVTNTQPNSFATKIIEVQGYLTKSRWSIDLEKLKPFIKEAVMADSSLDNELDLLTTTQEYVKENSQPVVTLSIDVVDFLASSQASVDWNKVKIGEIVNIYFPDFNVDTTAQLREIAIDFQANQLNFTISTYRQYTRLPATYLMRQIRKTHDIQINKVSYDYDLNRIGSARGVLTEMKLSKVGFAAENAPIKLGAKSTGGSTSTEISGEGIVSNVITPDPILETFDYVVTKSLTIADGNLLARNVVSGSLTSEIEISGDNGLVIRSIDGSGVVTPQVYIDVNGNAVFSGFLSINQSTVGYDEQGVFIGKDNDVSKFSLISGNTSMVFDPSATDYKLKILGEAKIGPLTLGSIGSTFVTGITGNQHPFITTSGADTLTEDYTFSASEIVSVSIKHFLQQLAGTITSRSISIQLLLSSVQVYPSSGSVTINIPNTTGYLIEDTIFDIPSINADTLRVTIAGTESVSGFASWSITEQPAIVTPSANIKLGNFSVDPNGLLSTTQGTFGNISQDHIIIAGSGVINTPFSVTIRPSNLTEDRDIYVPDQDGTILLNSTTATSGDIDISAGDDINLTANDNVIITSSTNDVELNAADHIDLVATNGTYVYGDLTVNNNLIVKGTTTTIDSTTLTVNDKNIEIGSIESATRLFTVLNGSDVISGGNTLGLIEGQTISGTGIPAGTTIASIITTGSLRMSANATANGTPGSLTFGRKFNTENGSPIITNGNTAGLISGQTITGTGIPANTTITSITSSTTLVMNNNATATNTQISLVFGSTTDTTASGGGITLKGATDKTIIWNNATAGWEFNETITTTGKIGVGTTSPLNVLDIRITGADSNDGIIIARADSITVEDDILGGIGFDSTDGNTPSSVLEASAYIAAFAAESQGTLDKGGYLTFGTAPINQDDDTLSLERVRITSEGEVLIGQTSTTGEKLQVNGVIKASSFNSTVATGTAPYSTTSTTLNTNLNADLLDGQHASAFVDLSSTQTITGTKTFNDLIVGGGGSSNWELDGSLSTAFYIIDASSTTRFTVLNNGNIGIATTLPGEKLEIVGNIKHTGLVMTSGTNVDQLKTTTFTSALTTSWTDVTGVSGTYLATGSYIVQIESNGEYYTGNMTWFSGTTTSTVADEIVLHRAGPAASAARIYARVIRTSSSPSTLKLQVSASTSVSSHTLTFKFRRTI